MPPLLPHVLDLHCKKHRGGRDADHAFSRSLRCLLELQVYVHDEQYLDMATAIVGSGPAYTYMFMEAMIDTGYELYEPSWLSPQTVSLHSTCRSHLVTHQNSRSPRLPA